MLQAAIGPRLENWPNESSNMNIGMPTKMRVPKYGIRNAPMSSVCKLLVIIKLSTIL